MSIKIWHITITYIFIVFFFIVLIWILKINTNDTISGSNLGNNKSYTITLYKEKSPTPTPIFEEKKAIKPPEKKQKSENKIESTQHTATQPKKQNSEPKPQPYHSKKNIGDIKSDKNLELVKGSEKEGLGGSSERDLGYIESILIYLQRYRYYPPLALKRHITGTVKVSLVINCDGSLQNYEITQSSGKDILDESVKSMLAKTNSFPIKDTCITPVAITVPIEFKMA